MAAQRIDKLLAGMGLCSRKEAAGYAKKGAVAVDGVICRDVSQKIDPETCCLTFQGTAVGYQKNIYLMLHKPLGVLSATEDREQKTVLDLLPKQYQSRGVFPVGRLDKETSGLLLLTDDGALGHMLTSPKRRVDKVYYAVTDGVLTEADVQAFADGIELRDGTKCLPAKLKILSGKDGRSEAEVTVQEGKYHQVRRMLAARGAPVLQLKRTAEGGICLDESLSPGDWRELSEHELDALKAEINREK